MRLWDTDAVLSDEEKAALADDLANMPGRRRPRIDESRGNRERRDESRGYVQ